MDALWAEAQAVQVKHVVRADERGVEGDPEQVVRAEGQAAGVLEGDHDVAVHPELTRQLQIDFAFGRVDVAHLRLALVAKDLVQVHTLHLVDFEEKAVTAGG